MIKYAPLVWLYLLLLDASLASSANIPDPWLRRYDEPSEGCQDQHLDVLQCGLAFSHATAEQNCTYCFIDLLENPPSFNLICDDLWNASLAIPARCHCDICNEEILSWVGCEAQVLCSQHGFINLSSYDGPIDDDIINKADHVVAIIAAGAIVLVQVVVIVAFIYRQKNKKRTPGYNNNSEATSSTDPTFTEEEW